MCCAIGLVCLCPAPSVDPDADRRCLSPRGVFRSNLSELFACPETFNEHTKHTVSPLDNVVLSVVVPWLTGVAKLLLGPWRDLSAVRLRSA